MNLKRLTESSALFLLAICAAGALMMQTASADLLQAAINAQGDFIYEIGHMPDLDQRRSTDPGPPLIQGLPGNGNMYCVPTSAMDIVMYIANHGFPEVAPGPDNWWDPATYDQATADIWVMGVLMGTDPVNGTGSAAPGLHAWLDAYNKFVIAEHFCNANSCPRVRDLALAGIDGNLVLIGYGKYNHFYFDDDFPNYIEVGDRYGGHAVVLAKAAGLGDNSAFELEVRDPASNDSQTVQSWFANKAYPVTEVDLRNSTDNWQRKMTVLNWYTIGGIAAVDGAITVRLKDGYSLIDGGHSLILNKPYHFSRHNCCVGKQPRIDLPAGKIILSFALHPDGDGAFAVVDNGAGLPRTLERINPRTGELEPLLEVGDGAAMTLARNRSAYVVRTDPSTGQRIVESVNIDAPPIPGQPIATIGLPDDAQAMASDDARDEVVLLSTTGSKLMRTDFTLTMTPTTMDIPASVPLGGNPQVAIDPTDAKVWILTDAADALFGLSQDPTGGLEIETLAHPAIAHPTGFDFDDAGHLFVGNDGAVVEMARNADGDWQVVPDSAYAGSPSEGMLRIARSSTNYDPAINAVPPPYNLDPDEVVSGTEIPDSSTGPDHVYDLLVEGLTATPDVPVVDQPVTLEATVRNAGEETVTDFAVDLYQDLGDSPPVVGQSGNVTCMVSSLDPGSTATCTGTVTYAATGEYIPWAQVDTQDTVPETDETNNTGRTEQPVTVTDTSSCAGDFDGDGDVDGTDLSVFAADLGRIDCGGTVPPCEGDLDGDGDVDGTDLAAFAAELGRIDCQ